MELSRLDQALPRSAFSMPLERADAVALVVALSDDAATAMPNLTLTPAQVRQLTEVLEASGPELTGAEAIHKALVGLSQLQQTLQDQRTRLIEHTATLAPLLQGLVDDLPPNLRWLLAEPVIRQRSQRQTSVCCPRCSTPLQRTPNGEIVCRVCSTP
jgi:hypothetical protein